MYKLKKTLKVSVLTFSVIFMLCLLSGTASAVMSADNAEDRLGVYSDWAESISDGQIYLKCPDVNVDEAYFADMLNGMFDNFKGEIGSVHFQCQSQCQLFYLQYLQQKGNCLLYKSLYLV